MSKRCVPTLAIPLCLTLAACPGGQGNDETTSNDTNEPQTTTTDTPQTTSGMPMTEDGGMTTSGGTTSGTTGPGATTDEPDTGASTMPEFVFDVGEIPEAPPLQGECGKVDFLFVVDNSGSMSDNQANLVANFPAFINGIQNNLEDVQTYQVGVVTTDAYSYNIPGCNNLSSLVVQTGGNNSSNMTCGPYDEGYNFMTEMDDLAVSFACAAQVGTVGSASERIMQAMSETVQKVDGGPGQCNEGFLRDDALLVIVLITDEPDNGSTGDPMSWYNDVLTAKLGIPENVVVVSLINEPGGACPGTDANDIAAFTTMWGINGFVAPICAPDWAPIFQQAIGIIDVACDNYIPPD